jgi:copper(I)-binding protein
MPRIRSRLFAALALACVPFAPSLRAAPPATSTQAADYGIMIHEAWARATAGASTTGVAYVTLMGGSRADSLVAVSTPVAATAELHESTNDNGVMKMRPVGPVAIPPNAMVIFAPEGTHIMLTGLKQKLVGGQRFPLTLTFAHAAPVTVDVEVRALGRDAAASPGGQMQMK